MIGTRKSCRTSIATGKQNWALATALASGELDRRHDLVANLPVSGLCETCVSLRQRLQISVAFCPERAGSYLELQRAASRRRQNGCRQFLAAAKSRKHRRVSAQAQRVLMLCLLLMKSERSEHGLPGRIIIWPGVQSWSDRSWHCRSLVKACWRCQNARVRERHQKLETHLNYLNEL